MEVSAGNGAAKTSVGECSGGITLTLEAIAALIDIRAGGDGGGGGAEITRGGARVCEAATAGGRGRSVGAS